MGGSVGRPARLVTVEATPPDGLPHAEPTGACRVPGQAEIHIGTDTRTDSRERYNAIGELSAS